MNELVKWKNPNCEKIEAALASAQKRGVERSLNTCELLCFCAVHDKPYTLRFERGPNGLFKHRESIKLANGSGGTSARLARPARSICAWCHAMPVVRE